MCHHGPWHVAWEKVLVHTEKQTSSDGVVGLRYQGMSIPVMSVTNINCFMKLGCFFSFVGIMVQYFP